MKWATRAHCHVDRTACAWLIRRFIDTEPTFLFVDDPDDVPADAVGFDMRGVELTHRDGGCSFETFLDRYDLDDPALRALARIVHEADVGDERFDAPEARGLDAVVRGMGRIYDDEELLRRTAPIYDGLYAYCGRDAAARGRTRTARD